MNERDNVNNSSLAGFLYGISAYTLWGFLPLYWKLLNKIPATEILAHRILWSFVFMCILIYFQGNFQKCKEVFSDRSNILRILCATVFITLNWGTFIWAVNSNHVVEVSMGYYINPLIVILLGTLVLKEKLNLWQKVSLVLAAIGVSIMTIGYGQIPWISIILASTFALYGLMKKTIPVGSTISLGLETAMLMPLTLAYIIYRQVQGIGALGEISTGTTLILMGTGIATALPLLFFTKGARRLPLSAIGFLQYIAPTITLILGVFIFKEPFERIHLISFGFIWSGLVIYSISQIKQMKRLRSKQSIISSK